MKVLMFLFACYCIRADAWGRGDLEKYGPFQLLINSRLIKCNHSRSLNLDVSGINVYFYDFSNQIVKSFPISTAAKEILALKTLETVKKFIVFVGGYKSHINKNTEERIRQTFTNFPLSYLLIIDHSPYTNDKDGNVKSYRRSVKYVYYIGKAIGEMLSELTKGGVKAKSIHCIGHSLGSQILGNTGETFMKLTGEKLWRITALDPAGPCFSNSLIQEQVRSGVAEYVEVYHCNAGALGTSSVIGDIDFFINKKGQSQPGCKTPLIPGFFDSPKAARCSHRTCIEVFTATVWNKSWFTARKCDSYHKFKKNSCSKDTALAGFWNPGTAKGVFYFSTEEYDLKKLDRNNTNMPLM